ncbi:MAG: hypothetical protein RLZZ373_696 [Pseudomonadota bacterium]|jgi:hypothetical protein
MVQVNRQFAELWAFAAPITVPAEGAGLLTHLPAQLRDPQVLALDQPFLVGDQLLNISASVGPTWLSTGPRTPGATASSAFGRTCQSPWPMARSRWV